MNRPKSDSVTEYKLITDTIFDASNNHATLLITHDYYSTDNSHGRHLLEAMLEAIRIEHPSITCVYLVDSAVKLIKDNSPLKDIITEIISSPDCSLIVCQDSLYEYEISDEDSSIADLKLSAVQFFAEILNSPDVITLC